MARREKKCSFAIGVSCLMFHDVPSMGCDMSMIWHEVTCVGMKWHVLACFDMCWHVWRAMHGLRCVMVLAFNNMCWHALTWVGMYDVPCMGWDVSWCHGVMVSWCHGVMVSCPMITVLKLIGRFPLADASAHGTGPKIWCDTPWWGTTLTTSPWDKPYPQIHSTCRSCVKTSLPKDGQPAIDYANMGWDVSASRPSSRTRSWRNLLPAWPHGTCGPEWHVCERHGFQWWLSFWCFCNFCVQIHRARTLEDSWNKSSEYWILTLTGLLTS